VVMRQAARVAYWAAAGAAILVFLYGVFLVVGIWRPVEMPSLVPIFLLGPTVVVLMSALHHLTPPERQVWSQISLSFAIIYATLVAPVHYLQLTVVRLNTPPFTADALRLIRLTSGSPTFALDLLGYTFLSLATWALVPTLGKGPETLTVRRLLTLHGVLAIPTVVVPAFGIGGDISPGGSGEFFGRLAMLLWCVVFVPMAAALARYLRSTWIRGDSCHR